MANIEGSYPTIDRVETGLWSLDRALSNNHELGWPMTIYEVFGFQGIGKTTFSTSIAGIVAEHYKKNIVYAPIEHVDRDFMNDILDSVKFQQVVTILGGWDMVKKFLPEIKKGKEDIVTDELLMDCMIEAVRRDDYCFGILDSLTAISPIEEAQSSVVDKNMGRRARLAGVLVRGILQANRFRTSPYSTIILSHKSTSMSNTPTNTGTATTGGESKKNIAKVRIGIRRMPEPTMNDLENNCYILEGKVEKMNFGRDKRVFYTAILGGQGINKNMTAVYECKAMKLASFGASITLDGKKYGRMASVVAEAYAGNDEFFQPFHDALRNPSKVAKVTEVEDDENESVFGDGEVAE